MARLLRVALPLFVVLGLIPLAGALAIRAHAAALPASPRGDVVLDASPWLFHLGDVTGGAAPGYDDSAWSAVSLPHTWNARDGEDGGNNYYRGVGWYRLHYPLSSAYAGRRLFLQFDGADVTTDVY